VNQRHFITVELVFDFVTPVFIAQRVFGTTPKSE
jgi:hypothetical protein